KDERIRPRRLRGTTLAALALACAGLAARPAAAQDPPPPLVPSEPDAPPPAPAPPPPDTPPKADAPPPSAPPPSAPPPSAPTPPLARRPRAPAETPLSEERTSKGSGARTLKKHAFITPFLVDSAITQTSLGLGLELGHQWELGVIPATSVSATRQPFQYDRS